MQLVPINDQIRGHMQDAINVEIANKDNKKSVYNLMPKKLKNIFNDKSRNISKWIGYDERDLKSELKGKLTPALNRLRYSFWNEYYRRVDNFKSATTGMLQQNIYGGVCSKEAYDKLLNDDLVVAWLLTPPTDTVVALQETLNYGLDRVREILELPIMKVDSVRVGPDEWEDREVVDDKVVNVILKAVAMLDLRLHGSYVQVQKVEQRSTVEHINNEPRDVTPPTDVDAEIAKLRSELTNKLPEPSKKVEDISSEALTMDEADYLAYEKNIDVSGVSNSKRVEKVIFIDPKDAIEDDDEEEVCTGIDDTIMML